MDSTKLYAKELALELHPDLYNREQDADLAERLEWRKEAIDWANALTVLLEDSYISPQDYTILVTQFSYVDGNHGIDVEATKKELAKWLRKLRSLGLSVEKKYDDYGFQLVAKIGRHKISIYASRQAVCEKKVVGTKVIPAQPERQEEIIEWECEKIVFTNLD